MREVRPRKGRRSRDVGTAENAAYDEIDDIQ